jgi:cell division protein FtsW
VDELPSREAAARRAAGTMPKVRRGADAARRGLAAWSPYYVLLAAVGALLAYGVVMVLSASSPTSYASTGDSYTVFKRQVVWVLAGVALMVVTSRVDYRLWRRLGLPLLALSLLGLLYVAVHPGAVSANGSTRWIPITSGIAVQPSEFAKLGLLLFAADVLTRKHRLLGDVRHLLVPVLPVTLLLAALVMAQPDLGTTLLVCAIAFGLLFIAGTPLPLLGLMATLGLAGGLGLIMKADYRRARLLSFLDPGASRLSSGYQIIQGRFALGSGGLLGVGLGASRQKWSYVPNAHTDFIFAIIGEELGLVGTMAILVLFAAIAYAGIRAARNAPEAFGRYLAGGITVWIVVQALVNIGAVVGVLPITGVPLPFVSAGGSSMLVLLAAAGMLLNVAKHEVWRAPAPVRATVAGERRRRRPTAAARPARAAARTPDGRLSSPVAFAAAEAQRLADPHRPAERRRRAARRAEPPRPHGGLRSR